MQIYDKNGTAEHRQTVLHVDQEGCEFIQLSQCLKAQVETLVLLIYDEVKTESVNHNRWTHSPAPTEIWPE